MSKARILLIVGIWVALLPYLGFPYIIKSILFVLTGLSLIYLSFLAYKEAREGTEGGRMFDNFSENNQILEDNEAIS